jgi:anti-sigma factor RsiW
MQCHDLQRQLESYLDGALGHAQQEALRRHLHRCPRCRAEVEAIRRFEDELAAAFTDGRTAPRLWERIALEQGPEVAFAPPPPKRPAQPAPARVLAGRGPSSFPRNKLRRPPPPVRRRRWTVVGAVVVLVVALGIALVEWDGGALDPAARSLLQAPILEFEVFRDSGRALDQAGADPWKLQAWLADRVRVDLPPPAVAEGFELRGGRLSILMGRRAATYAYGLDGREVALYVMPQAGLVLPPMVLRERQALALHEADGLTHLLFAQDGLAYSIVADLPLSRLLPLARAAGAVPADP